MDTSRESGWNRKAAAYNDAARLVRLRHTLTKKRKEKGRGSNRVRILVGTKKRKRGLREEFHPCTHPRWNEKRKTRKRKRKRKKEKEKEKNAFSN